MTKITYNDQNKNEIISILNSCNSIINTANSKLKETYAPSNFPYQSTLNMIKNDVNKAQKDLQNYKNSLAKITKTIDNNELELLSRLNKIEDIIIKEFNI